MSEVEAKTESLEKSSGSNATEFTIRQLMRQRAREESDESVLLPGEVVGLLKQLTGIDDVAAAVSEMTNDALARHARLVILERMALENDNEVSIPRKQKTKVHKSEAARKKRKKKTASKSRRGR